MSATVAQRAALVQLEDGSVIDAPESASSESSFDSDSIASESTSDPTSSQAAAESGVTSSGESSSSVVSSDESSSSASSVESRQSSAVESSSSSTVAASSESVGESGSESSFASSSGESSVSSAAAETASNDVEKPVTATFVTTPTLGRPSNVSPAFLVASHRSIDDADDLQSRIEATMTNADGDSIPVDVSVEEEPGGYRASVIPPSVIRPGTYRLLATLLPSRGDSRLGRVAETQLIDTRVEWGTVALNFDKSHYADGDIAALTVAPLIGTKTPPCVDSMSLASAGNVSDIDPTCDGSVVATVVVNAGDPVFRVDASIGSASWSVADAFPVNDDPSALDVRRMGPSSVVLGESATMTISVTASRGFRGAVTEVVPAGFEVSAAVPSATVRDRGDDGTTVEWSGSWEAGETRVLRYSYRAPTRAPTLALFGPLEADGVSTEFGPAIEDSVESRATSSASASSAESSSDASAESSSSEFPSSASASSADSSAESSADSSFAQSSEDAVIIEIEASDAPEVESTVGSFFSHMLASLFVDGETVSFDEDRAMQVMVVSPSETVELPSSPLELTPLHEHFEANKPATFRLLAGVAPETSDDDGSVSEDAALTTIVEQFADADTVRTVVLSAVVGNAKADIAQSFAEDSVSANEIRHALGSDDSSIRRMTTAVSTSVERVVAADEGVREGIADAVGSDPSVQAAMSALVSGELREAIAHEVATDGDVAAIVREFVDDVVPELPSLVAEASTAPDAVAAVAEAIAADSVSHDAPAEPIIEVSLTDRNGRTFEPSYHFKRGSLLLALEPERSFVPGMYTLVVTVTDPLTGGVQTFEQDFAWGVLAINADRDVYEPGGIAELHIGVLDDLGQMVCDADVTLSITAPDGSEQARTTDDGSIEVTDGCMLKVAGSIEPDYRTAVTLLQEGEYALSLTARTDAGERSMETTIPVRSSTPFRVTRAAATRLWPLAPSSMDVTVEFFRDVEGSVVDILPQGFEIESVEPAAEVSEREDGSIQVRWLGSWESGETAKFRYEYDAPDVSPQFYLIGPLEIRSESPLQLP